jgi:cytochrome b subunit of formate dehydrogenase
VIDDLLAQLPTARATWVLILTGLTGIAFYLSAFACDRLGHTIISPFLAAGA